MRTTQIIRVLKLSPEVIIAVVFAFVAAIAAGAAWREVAIAKRQVAIAKKQVAIAKKQVAIATELSTRAVAFKRRDQYDAKVAPGADDAAREDMKPEACMPGAESFPREFLGWTVRPRPVRKPERGRSESETLAEQPARASKADAKGERALADQPPPPGSIE
jgi:hypothetical protein